MHRDEDQNRWRARVQHDPLTRGYFVQILAPGASRGCRINVSPFSEIEGLNDADLASEIVAGSDTQISYREVRDMLAKRGKSPSKLELIIRSAVQEASAIKARPGGRFL